MTDLSIVGNFYPYDGYGSMARSLVRTALAQGVALNLIPVHPHVEDIDPIMNRLLGDSRPTADGPVFYYSMLRPIVSNFIGEDLTISTMWESDELPCDWPEILNAANGVIVPSTYVREVFWQNGVTRPIVVIPDGVDGDKYRLTSRPSNAEKFVVLVVGTFAPRKHTQEVVQAWFKAFGEDPHCQLILKSRFGEIGRFNFDPPRDSRVVVIEDSENTSDISHWYHQADVVVAAGSEGFGLPAIEAMACGVPVIVLDSAGQSDLCREARGLVLPLRPGGYRPAEVPGCGHLGRQQFPDVDHLSELLSSVRSNRQVEYERARCASAWVRKHRRLDMKGPRILEHLRTWSKSRF